MQYQHRHSLDEVADDAGTGGENAREKDRGLELRVAFILD